MMPTTRGGRAVAWGTYALLLAVAPLLWPGSFAQTLMAQVGIAIIACLAYNILLGQGGMLSFGHAVYGGLGAFAAMHALNQASAGHWLLPVSLVPLVGGAGGWLAAALLGHVSTRKAGTPFAMITLGMGELVWTVAQALPEYFGGEAGIVGNRVMDPAVLGVSFGPQVEVTYLIAFYCFACTVLMYAFTLTPLGRLLQAVRDNAERVAFIGHDPRHVRYLAFMLSGFFSGVAGGLAVLNFEVVSTEVLGASRSTAILLFVFLGGSTVFFGPMVGAVLMVLSLTLLPGWTRAWPLYLGLVFMFAVLRAPGGLAGLLLANWREGAWRRWRGDWRPGLVMLLSAAVALIAVAAMVEMAYHLRLDGAWAMAPGGSAGATMNFLGATLDAGALATWAGAGLALAVAVLVFELARRRLAPHGGER